MTNSQIEPTGPREHATAGASNASVNGSGARRADLATLHVIIINHATGEPTALLVEREPGIVEFPVLLIRVDELANSDRIAAAIKAETGLDAVVGGFLAADGDSGLVPAGSRFLLARGHGGRPTLKVNHLGWEWRPVANLLEMQFIPKPMVNELRSYMYGQP